MCGILGLLAPQSTADLGGLQAILESQTPRGPDYARIDDMSSDGVSCFFGHNRLSIIDLTSASNQPFYSHDGRYAVSFNGEIYNFLEIRAELESQGCCFNTTGDTEVLLQAYMSWGRACFSKFNGMFAVALYDRQTHELLLVRDRFGVKPLFWLKHDGGCYFASTSQALARQFALQPNYSFAARGLMYLCYEVGAEDTEYQDLYSVLPGTGLSIHLGENGVELETFRYYDLAKMVSERAQDLEHLGEQALVTLVRTGLDDSIALRARADVRLGVSLSGGIDSGAVFARAVALGYSVRPYVFGAPDNPLSEAKTAGEIAQKHGVVPRFVSPTATQVVDAFEKVLLAQGAPVATLSALAQHFVYEAARADGTLVIMGGQGGDEVFMGYRKYQFIAMSHLVRSTAMGMLFRELPGFVKFLFAEVDRFGEIIRGVSRYSGCAQRTSSWIPDGALTMEGLSPYVDVQRRQMLDVTQYSLPTLLRIEDRNSSSNSVESRLPFLDYRLVETGLALPLSLKVHQGYGKWVLRQALQDGLPKSVLFSRKKRGFDAPERLWLQEGLGDRIRSIITRWTKWSQADVSAERYFANERLMSDPLVLREALFLCWLALGDPPQMSG